MSRPKGNSNVLSINLGTFETAPARRDAYIKAATAARCWSLGDWCKKVMDKAAGFKDKHETKNALR